MRASGATTRGRATRATTPSTRATRRRARARGATRAAGGDATPTPTPTTPTTDVARATTDADDGDWAYETIAGRCAMAGYAIGAQIEAQTGSTLAEQASTATGGVVAVALCCVVAWASLSPFEFNPQEYGANPNLLREKKGMSGFLAMEALNLNVDVERAHGRLAMLGFVGTALVEAALGRSVF